MQRRSGFSRGARIVAIPQAEPSAARRRARRQRRHRPVRAAASCAGRFALGKTCERSATVSDRRSDTTGTTRDRLADLGTTRDRLANLGTTRDRLAIFAAAALFSTGGVAIKGISVGAWEVAGIRAVLAAAAIWVLVPGTVSFRRGAVLAAGAAQGATMLLFVLSNKTTTAANAIFLQATAPLYIPLLARRLLGEHATRRDIAAMAGISVGLGCFFLGSETPTSSAPDPALGNLFAMASGLAWAATVVGLRYLAREAPTDVNAAKGALIAGNLLVAAVALPMADLSSVTKPGDWLLLVFLGVVQVALSYRLLVGAVARVPALEASLLTLFEPVLNPLWALLVLAEMPSGWALTGAAVVATVTVLRAAAGSRR
jgi:DME family drug/metabolite transporter